jgi:hypothetical protein
VAIDIVVEIETNCRMDAGNKNSFWERRPKGSVTKVMVTLSLRSMPDVVIDAMMANGADVNSFIGSGRSLHTNDVTDLWHKCSGYHDTVGVLVIAGSTGSCSYPMSMRI